MTKFTPLLRLDEQTLKQGTLKKHQKCLYKNFQDNYTG